jgi:TonB family protein
MTRHRPKSIDRAVIAQYNSRMKAQHIFLFLALLACTVFAQDSSPQQKDSGPSASSAAPSELPRVSISAGVSHGLLIHQVNPMYPPDAKKNHVQGSVVLRAFIGRDGIVQEVQVIKGPEELTQAAIDAVKQWRYKPYYLNGEPRQVETSVIVNFTLAGS